MTDLSSQRQIARPHPVRAPRGSQISCRNWLIEAAYRMIQNNLDPEVAENPDALVVYGGIGKAARNWDCYEAILHSLLNLQEDESLLIQSGKPVGVFRTHVDAPRVLIANSNLVPQWATWEHFAELDRKGLMMYGQMTAGSWIYIGSQGIVQGTYETFVEAGRQHYPLSPSSAEVNGGSLERAAPRSGQPAAPAQGGEWAGRWILTAGLGGMGGAQPLAASFAGASSLTIECQQSRIDFRLHSRYLDEQASDLDDALARIAKYTAEKRAVSIGLLGNAAEIVTELARRAREGGPRPDLVTDQTSAHDLVNGYLPAGWSVERWQAAQADAAQHEALRDAAAASCAVHVQALLDFHAMGVPTVDYGNNIRQVAFDRGVRKAFDFPGFVPAYIRPLFCRGVGPFRWVALSGDPEDIRKTDAKMKELFPADAHLHRWLAMASERIAFQGLPARICWIGLGDRHRAGLAFNEMVKSGELKAPIVIGRDHLDSGVGGESEPRDRGDARRLRRRFRLAAAECAAEHRWRRNLGQLPPWRRGRHGLFAACRRRHRLRRQRRGGPAHRACALERPGHRRHAPRRRRLRRSADLRCRAGAEAADDQCLIARRCGSHRAG